MSLTAVGPNDSDANLRAYEAFRFVEDKVDIGVWSWDLKSGKMTWSKGLFQLLGLEPGAAEPGYAAIESMIHPDDRRSQVELERLRSEGGKTELKFRVCQKDGRIRWLLSRGEFFAEPGGPSHKAICVLIDVTAIHTAESNAAVVLKRHAFVLEATAAVVWTVNGDWTPREVTGWIKLTGQQPANMTDNGWLQIVHVDDRQRVMQARDLALVTRTPFECEYRMLLVDKTYRWFRSRAVPTFASDGTITEWSGVTMDIHDYKIWSSPIEPSTITGAQLRAARGILNLSVNDLATASNTSVSSIRRLEEIDGASTGSETILLNLRVSLESAGLEFYFPIFGNSLVRRR
jgi:PAS domain-containing protein